MKEGTIKALKEFYFYHEIGIKIMLLALLIVVPIMITIIGCTSSYRAYSGEAKTVTEQCEVCNREFDDNDNKKSIRMTNMCTVCYKNFKYAQG